MRTTPATLQTAVGAICTEWSPGACCAFGNAEDVEVDVAISIFVFELAVVMKEITLTNAIIVVISVRGCWDCNGLLGLEGAGADAGVLDTASVKGPVGLLDGSESIEDGAFSTVVDIPSVVTEDVLLRLVVVGFIK